MQFYEHQASYAVFGVFIASMLSNSRWTESLDLMYIFSIGPFLSMPSTCSISHKVERGGYDPVRLFCFLGIVSTFCGLVRILFFVRFQGRHGLMDVICGEGWDLIGWRGRRVLNELVTVVQTIIPPPRRLIVSESWPLMSILRSEQLASGNRRADQIMIRHESPHVWCLKECPLDPRYRKLGFVRVRFPFSNPYHLFS